MEPKLFNLGFSTGVVKRAQQIPREPLRPIPGPKHERAPSMTNIGPFFQDLQRLNVLFSCNFL
jgi:hypothetical protein